METIQVLVGDVVTASNGFVQDNTREVEFVGEELASRMEYDYDYRRGSITDLRGVTETLYKTEDGRYIVHVKDWSRWVNEPTRHSLLEVTEDDLGVNGRFEALGREAGMGQPLTLDEVLAPPPA